jgi:hypothetical protein
MIHGSKTCLSWINLESVKFFPTKEAWVMEGVPRRQPTNKIDW